MNESGVGQSKKFVVQRRVQLAREGGGIVADGREEVGSTNISDEQSVARENRIRGCVA